MNRDDIIRMAREACDKDKVDAWQNGFWVITQEELERFFHMAQAAEREECAKVCESQYIADGSHEDLASMKCAEAIRARGQA